MIRLMILRRAFVSALIMITLGVLISTQTFAQSGKRAQRGRVCSDPNVACKTTAVFDINDLPFQVSANAVIWESEDFYAIILKSVASPDDNCAVFVPESDRLAAQALFPKRKVFTSRCTMAGNLFYTNTASSQQFMAVYGGATKAQADQMLATVKATGKYPGANIRRMRVGFNGT